MEARAGGLSCTAVREVGGCCGVCFRGREADLEGWWEVVLVDLVGVGCGVADFLGGIVFVRSRG